MKLLCIALATAALVAGSTAADARDWHHSARDHGMTRGVRWHRVQPTHCWNEMHRHHRIHVCKHG